MTTKEPRTPAQLAGDASEAVRALNHLTLSDGPDWEHPADAYSTVAGLAEMAGRLPQLLGQMETFIGMLGEQGHLSSDKGEEELPERLLAFHRSMAAAATRSRELYYELNQVHQLLSPIAYKD